MAGTSHKDFSTPKDTAVKGTTALLASLTQAEALAQQFFLSWEMDHLHKTCESGRGAIENLKKQIEAFKKARLKVEGLQEALGGEEGELQRLTTQNKQLSRLYQENQASLRRSQNEKAEVQQQKIRLEAELANLKREVKEARAQLVSINSQNDTAKRTLETPTSEDAQSETSTGQQAHCVQPLELETTGPHDSESGQENVYEKHQEDDCRRRVKTVEERPGDVAHAVARNAVVQGKLCDVLSEVNQELKAPKESHTTSINNEVARVHSLETTLSTTIQELSQVKADFIRFEAEARRASNIEQRLTSTARDLVYYQAETEANATKISDLEGRLRTVEKEQNRTRAEHDEVKTAPGRIAMLEQQQGALNSRIDDVEGLLATLPNDQDRLRVKLTKEQRLRVTNKELDAQLTLLSNSRATTPSATRPANGRLPLQSARRQLEDVDQEDDDREMESQEFLQPRKRQKTANPADSRISRHSSNRAPPSQPKTATSFSSPISQSESSAEAFSSSVQPDPVGEPWLKVEDVRRSGYRYGNLPDALFGIVRHQMLAWDRVRPEWINGPLKGDVKCANQFADRHGSNVEDGYACVACAGKGMVCVVVQRGLVQIRPLRPEDRGEATKGDLAYWSITAQ